MSTNEQEQEQFICKKYVTKALNPDISGILRGNI